MVLYYMQQAAVKAGHAFRFIDQAGLADDTLDMCRHGIAATSHGQVVDLSRVVAGDCGPLPDILIEVDKPTDAVKADYVIAYEQQGAIRTTSRPHGTAVASTSICVCRDLITGARSGPLTAAIKAVNIG